MEDTKTRDKTICRTKSKHWSLESFKRLKRSLFITLKGRVRKRTLIITAAPGDTMAKTSLESLFLLSTSVRRGDKLHGLPSQINTALLSVSMQHVIKLLQQERKYSDYLLNKDIFSIWLPLSKTADDAARKRSR